MKNLDFPINRGIAKPRLAAFNRPIWITIFGRSTKPFYRLDQTLSPLFTLLVQNADIVLEELY
jgi:hypothetical protein